MEYPEVMRICASANCVRRFYVPAAVRNSPADIYSYCPACYAAMQLTDADKAEIAELKRMHALGDIT